MTRQAAHEIDPLFLRRWSPRAMSGAPVDVGTLNRLFEAARWAPSSSNQQPWRFAYAVAGTPHFAEFLDLLVPANQAWCNRAGALIVVASKATTNDGSPSPTHAFDTGAAWMSLALQGTLMDLVVHGMAGFDYERAATVVHLPQDHQVECMIAVGHHGDVAQLPERLRAREQPNDRVPITTFVVEGKFGER